MQHGSPHFRYRDQLSNPAFNILYGAPLLIVIAATSNAPQSAEDCCLAAQNLMLAARTMGLGTYCVGFARPWLGLAETKAELGIPPSYAPIIPIATGHPKSAAASVPRQRPEVHCVRQDDGVAAAQPSNGTFGQGFEAGNSRPVRSPRDGIG